MIRKREVKGKNISTGSPGFGRNWQKGFTSSPLLWHTDPLGMGKTYELLHWEVLLAMITTTLGLVAFASALERYFLRRTTRVETFLFWIAAIGLFWPSHWTDSGGFIALTAAILLQKFYHNSPTAPAGI